MCTDLHYPSVNLKKFQTGVHYMGVKLYSSLPTYIKTEINNEKYSNYFWRNFYLRIHSILLQNYWIWIKDLPYSFYFLYLIDIALNLSNYYGCT
jgi:hypothetical protein